MISKYRLHTPTHQTVDEYSTNLGSSLTTRETKTNAKYQRIICKQ